MESRLGQHSVTRQQRFSNTVGEFSGPRVVLILPITEGHEEARIGNRFHLREKPFRVDRFAGPATAPASRRNGFFSDVRAFASSSRMMRPLGTPVLRDVSSSHCARSSGRRTVIVLPIYVECNTAQEKAWRIHNGHRCDARATPIFPCMAGVCRRGWPIG